MRDPLDRQPLLTGQDPTKNDGSDGVHWTQTQLDISLNALFRAGDKSPTRRASWVIVAKSIRDARKVTPRALYRMVWGLLTRYRTEPYTAGPQRQERLHQGWTATDAMLLAIATKAYGGRASRAETVEVVANITRHTMQTVEAKVKRSAPSKGFGLTTNV